MITYENEKCYLQYISSSDFMSIIINVFDPTEVSWMLSQKNRNLFILPIFLIVRKTPQHLEHHTRQMAEHSASLVQE